MKECPDFYRLHLGRRSWTAEARVVGLKLKFKGLRPPLVKRDRITIYKAVRSPLCRSRKFSTSWLLGVTKEGGGAAGGVLGL